MIFLDRDGVINRMHIDPEHGLVDSPLVPEQVELLPGAAQSVRKLTEAGETIVVVTNQPSAAKGKTTRANLERVHALVLELVQADGGKIAGSYICWHRAEDHCPCRKPKTGLLESAWREHGGRSAILESWIVGDGITDVEAGKAFGIRTAFLGPKKCDHCKALQDRSVEPDMWAGSLLEWVDNYLRRRSGLPH